MTLAWRCPRCGDTHDPAYDCLTMDALIASLREPEWEWGPIGDNTLAYCNWAHRVAKRDGEDYHDVWVRHRDEVARRWRSEVSPRVTAASVATFAVAMLTPTERKVLGLALRRGGLPLDNVHTPTGRRAVRDLLDAEYLCEQDHGNDGTWTLHATRAGRSLYQRPIVKREPLRLMRGARTPNPDPRAGYILDRDGNPRIAPIHRTVPEPEIMDPPAADITRARLEGIRQRASFARDLEAERARRKAERRPWARAA